MNLNKKHTQIQHSDDLEKIYRDNNSWGITTSVDLRSCNPNFIRDANHIKKFTVGLCKLLDVVRIGECKLIQYGAKKEIQGFSMVQLIDTSLISGHFAEALNNAYLDIFSCKYHDPVEVYNFALNFFEADPTTSSLHYHFRQK